MHFSSSHLLLAISPFRWYQIKISMRWEDSEYTSVGTPARVVQYEGIFANVLIDEFLNFFQRAYLSSLLDNLRKVRKFEVLTFKN